MYPEMSPLADRVRPEKLSQVVGQDQLIAKGKLLYEVVKSKQPTSLIFWGPPGSGKTTLARIIAKELKARFVEISAVNANKKDIQYIIDNAKTDRRLKIATILFIDEIHRFNKAQQDSFLPYVEDGTINIFGATTENPSFEIISALLSRCTVVVLNPLSIKDLTILLKRAIDSLNLPAKLISSSVIEYIAHLSQGDGRSALNILDLAIRLSKSKPINKEIVESAAQKTITLYDKNGEYHYNLISAFIKSLRGSDINAAFYYLSRLIEGGEDPKFIARRMIIFASEDVGLAASAALNIAVSTFLAVERIGMPECEYNLYHCAAVLAKAPKSRDIASGMNKSKNLLTKYPNLPVPLHLRNAPTKMMEDLGYNQGYKWQAGFKDKRGFLPPEIDNINFFNDSD